MCMEKINIEIWNEFANIKIDKRNGKIKKLRRLQRILRELSTSNKEEDVLLIAKIASKYVSKGEDADKDGAFLFHPLNKGEIYNALYMDSILDTLYKANTKFNNEILHELGNQHLEFIDYKIQTATRLFSPEYVFEHFADDVIKYSLKIQLEKGYEVYEKCDIDDTQRTWDKRWGKLLCEKGAFYDCFPLLYNSDVETWEKLLSKIQIPIFSQDSGLTQRQFRQDCRWYAEVLQIAYKNNHPQKEFYYKKWLEQGFPKDLLDKYIKKAN